MTTTMLTVACLCGATAEREPATGRWSRQLDRMPYQCEDCAAEAKALAAIEQAVQDEQTRRHRTQRGGLPVPLQGLTWSDVDETSVRADAIAAARAWATDELRGVALAGAIGAGKTRIAAIAANEIARRRPVSWMNAPSRLGSLADGSMQGETRATVLGGGALVLEDLDRTRPTDLAAELMYLAIDQRVERDVPLLVTMTATLDEFAAKYPQPFGDAIASRLAGHCRRARVEGPDRRGAAHNLNGGHR